MLQTATVNAGRWTVKGNAISLNDKPSNQLALNGLLSDEGGNESERVKKERER